VERSVGGGGRGRGWNMQVSESQLEEMEILLGSWLQDMETFTGAIAARDGNPKTWYQWMFGRNAVLGRLAGVSLAGNGRFCVRLTDGFTCTGPDLPLQERYQAGTLEVSLLFRSHEQIEEHDSLSLSLSLYHLFLAQTDVYG
jgi:hypothetical protein